MAVAIKCDICGEFYEPYNIASNVITAKITHNGLMFVSIDAKREYYEGGVKDCCPNCLESIKNHIESLKK